MGTASKALSIALATKRLVNVENKHHDTSSTAQAMPDTGVVIELADMAQGDGVQNRDGDSVKLLRSTLRFQIFRSSTAVSTVARVIIFRGKQENGTIPTVGDVLESTGSPASVNSPKNYSERFRTKILYDKNFILDNHRQRVVDRSKVFKLYGHVNYTTASTNIEDGGLYMLVISNESTLTPTISYYNRLSYVDN